MDTPISSSEHEYALTGCAITEFNFECQEALSLIEDHMWQNAESRCIATAIRKLQMSGLPVDLINVSEEMDRIGSGIAFNRLGELCKTHLRPYNAKAYAKRIKDIWQLNNAIKQLDFLRSDIITDRDVDSALTKISQIGGSISLTGSDKEPIIIGKVVDELLDSYMKQMDGEIKQTEFIGIKGVDDAFGMIGETDLIIISGTPGSGKTELSVKIANHFAFRHKKPVLFIELEMTNTAIAKRVLANEANMSTVHMDNHDAFTEDAIAWKLESGLTSIKDAEMYLHEMLAPTVDQFAAVCRKFCTKHANVGAIFLDHFHLLRFGKADRHDISVTNASKALKVLAKELRVPIFALAQPSRDVEKTGRRPTKSDLRDGAIEMDADSVVFIDRQCINNPETEWRNIAQLIMAKKREGVAKDGYMSFKDGHFYECSDEDEMLIARIKNGVSDDQDNGKRKKFDKMRSSF